MQSSEQRCSLKEKWVKSLKENSSKSPLRSHGAHFLRGRWPPIKFAHLFFEFLSVVFDFSTFYFYEKKFFWMHFTIESARELSARRSARVPHWDMLKITRFLLWFGPNFALLGCMGEHRKHPVEPLIISPDYVSHIVTLLKRCACDFCADFIEIFAWNMIFIAGFDLKFSNGLLFFNDFCVFSFEF